MAIPHAARRHACQTLTLLLVTSVAAGQVAVQPAGRGPDIATLVAQLSDTEGWWTARANLLRLGKTDQQAVLRAVAPVARTGKGVVKRRARLVLDALIDQHVRAHKQRERLRYLEAVKDRLADLDGAAGKRARAAVASAMADLEKCLATETPLKMVPLTVPIARRPAAPKPAKKAGGPDDLEKNYRKIKVGDKTFLVPKKDLGDGDAYKAEFKNGALNIFRFPKKPKAKPEKAKPEKAKPEKAKPEKAKADKEKAGKEKAGKEKAKK